MEDTHHRYKDDQHSSCGGYTPSKRPLILSEKRLTINGYSEDINRKWIDNTPVNETDKSKKHTKYMIGDCIYRLNY